MAVYSIQHYVIKFVSDLRQVCGFSPGTQVSSTTKIRRHDIAEILLKVAQNTYNSILIQNDYGRQIYYFNVNIRADIF